MKYPLTTTHRPPRPDGPPPPAVPDEADEVRRPLPWWAAGLWGVTLAAGVGALWKYEATPGQAAEISVAWPGGLALPLDPERPTLVMILHARCPCSRASVAELASLMSRSPGRVTAYAVVVDPVDPGAAGPAAPMLSDVEAIPGVTPVRDVGGAIAARFASGTSGQTFLYTSDGMLRFHGGITAGRGHVGPNAGSDAIEEILWSLDPADRASARPALGTPVYGCSID